ncbi:N-acetyltransferase [Phreatobacter aquaticus]|uniref:N-acetyltransferase n=1 Tax=Phreatobacter aquaticus TaxID=2570229 RepID=A0A4D7QGE5_9HYPH|nr:GNAT family N-acetyltransferase [Phreatobacter aquaticus]QCK84457.1 N-acetyltransferase [Phreatobacter aquaticus]
MSGDVTVVDNPGAKRFEAVIGDQVAVAEYVLGDGTITFTHTLVPPELGGRGIGKALVKAGLAAARERGLKVIPLCPFFARHFADHPEARDLLEANWRASQG